MPEDRRATFFQITAIPSKPASVRPDDVSLYNKEGIYQRQFGVQEGARLLRPTTRYNEETTVVEGSRAVNFARAVIATTLEQRLGLINCGPFLICLARRRDYREIFKPIRPVEPEAVNRWRWCFIEARREGFPRKFVELWAASCDDKRSGKFRVSALG